MAEKETIFCADDSQTLRKSLVFALAMDGHQVVAQAESPETAYPIIDNQEIEFRVAIVDNRMPAPGDGERVAKRIREKRPGTFIISLSSDDVTFGDVNVNKLAENGPQLLIDAINNVPA